ncbi:MAG TPA: UTRA domain-containing protein [Patescibacteria group bacterium]|nr:UTRA domain-containing protein [Patescibacteria group bacterium]
MTEQSHQPHYRPIESALRERISNLRPGERVPSDAGLCVEFQVSRMTARHAIVLRRGTGTISAAAATAEDARLHAVRMGDPLLVERRVIADVHGRRVEATESRYPADRYGLDVQFDVEGAEPDEPDGGDR